MLVPETERRTGGALVAAVRASGADPELAARVSAVRDRLLARRYGPEAKAGEDAKLTAEVQDVVQRLGGSLKAWRGGGTVRGAAVLALALCGPAALRAQTPAPEQLYASGSLRAAADAFARRTDAEPAVAAHWYNLGAAYFRMGLTGRAAAAWLEARRLAPRQATIRRALALTPPPDLTTARLTWSPPLTPEELLLLGGAGMDVGWLGWGLRPRIRDRWTVLLVLSACAVLGGLALRVWYRRPVAIVTDASTLRLSPHGLAPAVSPVEAGAQSRSPGAIPGWVLVERSGIARRVDPERRRRRHRRLDSRHDPAHRHPSRRRSRSDRRGRSRRAPRLGRQGAGGECPRCRRDACAGGAGERRQDAHRGERRRRWDGPGRRGPLSRPPRDEQGTERRRPGGRRHVRLSRRGAAGHRLGLAPHAHHVRSKTAPAPSSPSAADDSTASPTRCGAAARR